MIEAKRHDWVDYAKFIGIVLVVYGHVSRGLVSAGIEVNEPVHKFLDNFIYCFHMPLFFFLSGVLFIHSFAKKNWLDFSSRKIDSIVYPYIIWSIAQGTIEATLAKYTNGAIGFSDVFELLWKPRAQFWFLYTLFLILMIAALVYIRKDIFWCFGVFLIAFALYFARPYFDWVWVWKLVVTYGVFFAAGVLFSFGANWFQERVRILCLPLLCLSVGGFYYLIYKNNIAYSEFTIQVFCVAIVLIGLAVALSMWLSGFDIKLLSLIGSCSMAIYLLHIIVGSGVRIVMARYMAIDDYFLHLLFGTMLGLLVPVFLFKISGYGFLRYMFTPPSFISARQKLNA